MIVNVAVPQLMPDDEPQGACREFLRCFCHVRALLFESWRECIEPRRGLYDFVASLKSEHRGIGRKAEEDTADRLVMRLPPLGLLRGGMHVAEAALERTVVEDRRSTSAVIEGVDDLASLVNGPGRGEADLRVLF